MATNKRVFTLRLSDEVFDKIGILATNEHRSLTNYIEYVLIRHIEEKENGKIDTSLNEQSYPFHNRNGPECGAVSLFFILSRKCLFHFFQNMNHVPY